MECFKHLLVIGGAGILGSAIVKVFKNNSNLWKVIVIDYTENNLADKNIIIDRDQKLNEDIVKSIYQEIEIYTKSFDAIFNVAGDWTKGSIKYIKVFSETELMLERNYYSSLLAAHLATKYLSEGGLLLFTGAAKLFKDAAPEMIAYQIAKTAVHSLAMSLSESRDLPNDTTIITILPEIIDTPDNRTNMPSHDCSKWTKPEGMAALLKMWADGYNRPKSGSFAVLKNKDNYVVPEFV